MTEIFYKAVDDNSACFYMFYVATRWFAFKLDMVTTVRFLYFEKCDECLPIQVLSAVTALLVVLSHGQISPAMAGLALVYVTAMAGVFQFTARLKADVR